MRIPKLIPGGELPAGPVLVIENEKEFASLLSHHDLDFEETCKLKQGYVAEVTGITLDGKITAIKIKIIAGVERIY